MSSSSYLSSLHVLFLTFLFFICNFMAFGLRSTYIVHMDNSFMPKTFNSSFQWYSSLVRSLNTTNSTIPTSAELLYSYDYVMHGFSAFMSSGELQVLCLLPGFISAYPDKLATLDTTYTYKFLSLSSVSGIWPASSFGDNVIIGIIDTGIWPESKSFQDYGMTKIPKRWKGECDVSFTFNSSMCNRKLIGARVFNFGYMYSSSVDITVATTAVDEVGHGTYTSSIVAGNGASDASYFGYADGYSLGIAPSSRIAMYKVSGDDGITYASDLLAGFDQAISDGVDIISISYGFNRVPIYEDPIAIASFAAMEKGIFVSTSAGNGGTTPLSLHNGAPWMCTVGASTVDRQFSGTLTLGSGLTLHGWSLFPENALILENDLLYDESHKACNWSFSSQNRHKVILCEAKADFFTTLDWSSITAAIIITNHPSNFIENVDFPFPAILIDSVNADRVIEYTIAYSKPVVSIKFQQTITGSNIAPVLSFFSSRGPSPSYPGILKPDLIAPGSRVLAAWPLNAATSGLGSTLKLSSEYNLVSGTSVACPHVSGVAALLKAANPDWSVAAIRSAMMTTAQIVDNASKPIRDGAATISQGATPLGMGSGQIDPNKAFRPGLVYNLTTQDYVNLLCSSNYTHQQITAITKNSSYDCSNPSEDLNYPSFITFFNNASSSVKTFQRTVTNVEDSAATYKAKFELNAGFFATVYPDILVFEEKNQKLNFTLSVINNGGFREGISYGYLIWVDDVNERDVRSPIVVVYDGFESKA